MKRPNQQKYDQSARKRRTKWLGLTLRLQYVSPRNNKIDAIWDDVRQKTLITNRYSISKRWDATSNRRIWAKSKWPKLPEWWRNFLNDPEWWRKIKILEEAQNYLDKLRRTIEEGHSKAALNRNTSMERHKLFYDR